MKSGYDQFFKQARKAAGSVGSNPADADRSNSTSKRAAFTKSMKNASGVANDSQFALSSEELSQEVEKQLRHRAGVRPKKIRKKVSWKMATLSLAGVVVCIAGAANYEKVENFMQNFEITLLGQAQAESKPVDSKKESATGPKTEAKSSSEAGTKASAVKGGSESEVTNSKSEDMTHLQKLVDRKKQLDDREAELARTEDEIAKQKEEVEKRMKELEDMRGKISSILEERVKLDETKIDGLMQMYTNMKPPQAAKVFESMDEDLAVEILGRMKKKSAAEILNLLKPEKAQVISEKYAGFRRQPATVKNDPVVNNKEGKP